MRTTAGKRLCLYLLALAVGLVSAGAGNTLPVRALSLNPSDYFSYNYSIEFDTGNVAKGEVFYARFFGEATCVKDAPVHPSEARIKGRVIAEHIETGRLVSLNSGYSVSISPVPSMEGETIYSVQEIPLYFPWDSPTGAYRVNGELVSASFKAVIWFDATGYFPANQPMGDINYGISLPEPEPDDEPEIPANNPEPEPSESEPTENPVPAPTQEPAPFPDPEPGTPTPQEPVTLPVTTVPAPAPVVVPQGATPINSLGVDGSLEGELSVVSADEMCRLYFEPGTKITGSDGKAALWVSIGRQEMPETAGIRVLSPAYSFANVSGFEPSGSLAIGYYQGLLPESMDKSLLSIGRWNEQSSQWVVLTGCRVDEVSSTISVNIQEPGTYCALAPVSPPDFAVSGFSVSPPKASTGELITVQCSVTNSGGTAGFFEAVLKLNGAIAEVKRIELAGGAKQVVTFGVVRNGEGHYLVELNGFSGSFDLDSPEVTLTQEPPPGLPDLTEVESPSFNWLAAVYTINACLLVAAAWLGRTHIYSGYRFIRRKIGRLF